MQGSYRKWRILGLSRLGGHEFRVDASVSLSQPAGQDRTLLGPLVVMLVAVHGAKTLLNPHLPVRNRHSIRCWLPLASRCRLSQNSLNDDWTHTVVARGGDSWQGVGASDCT